MHIFEENITCAMRKAGIGIGSIYQGAERTKLLEELYCALDYGIPGLIDAERFKDAEKVLKFSINFIPINAWFTSDEADLFNQKLVHYCKCVLSSMPDGTEKTAFAKWCERHAGVKKNWKLCYVKKFIYPREQDGTNVSRNILILAENDYRFDGLDLDVMIPKEKKEVLKLLEGKQPVNASAFSPKMKFDPKLTNFDPEWTYAYRSYLKSKVV